ncbi:MAG: hypothetical protein R3C28_17365 [Pirellulaceae bacterium]
MSTKSTASSNTSSVDDSRCWLLVQQGGGLEERVAFRKDRLKVGSSPSCDIVVPTNFASPMDVLLLQGKRGVAVRNWANHARLNGRPFGDAWFTPQDQLAIGDVHIRIESSQPGPNLSDHNVSTVTADCLDREIHKRQEARHSATQRLKSVIRLLRRKVSQFHALEQRLADLQDQHRLLRNNMESLESQCSVFQHDCQASEEQKHEAIRESLRVQNQLEDALQKNSSQRQRLLQERESLRDIGQEVLATLGWEWEPSQQDLEDGGLKELLKQVLQQARDLAGRPEAETNESQQMLDQVAQKLQVLENEGAALQQERAELERSWHEFLAEKDAWQASQASLTEWNSTAAAPEIETLEATQDASAEDVETQRNEFAAVRPDVAANDAAREDCQFAPPPEVRSSAQEAEPPQDAPSTSSFLKGYAPADPDQSGDAFGRTIMLESTPVMNAPALDAGPVEPMASPLENNDDQQADKDVEYSSVQERTPVDAASILSNMGYAPELDDADDPDTDSENDDLPGPTGSVLNPQPVAQDGHADNDQEEDISKYMEQLLQRVTGGPSNYSPAPVVAKPVKVVNDESPECHIEAEADLPPLTMADFKPMAKAPESDIAGMREVANQTARNAINQYARKVWFRRIILNWFVVVCLALASFSIMAWARFFAFAGVMFAILFAATGYTAYIAYGYTRRALADGPDATHERQSTASNAPSFWSRFKKQYEKR